MNYREGIERFEARRWKAPVDLRARFALALNAYIMPIILQPFARQGSNRYYNALAGTEADKVPGKFPKRDPVEADCSRRGATMLLGAAQHGKILERPEDGTLGAAQTGARVARKGGSLGLPYACQMTAARGRKASLDAFCVPSTAGNYDPCHTTYSVGSGSTSLPSHRSPSQALRKGTRTSRKCLTLLTGIR